MNELRPLPFWFKTRDRLATLGCGKSSLLRRLAAILGDLTSSSTTSGVMSNVPYALINTMETHVDSAAIAIYRNDRG